MAIQVSYIKGTLILDLHSILEQVQPEQKREMLESLSCDDEVIDFVAQQIIGRWTESGYGGGSFVHALAAPYGGLDKAWRDVAKASGDIARREVQRLEEALKSQTDENNRLRSENIQLRRGEFHA